jgi:predicted DNA-binding protein
MQSSVKAHTTNSQTRRLSVSLPSEHYEQLTSIAQKNRVSIAWVVRDAIERLLRDDVTFLHARRPE